MPLGGALTVGLSALGGMFANRSATSKQTSNTTSHQVQDSSTMPQYDAKSQALRDQLINAYLWNMQSNDDYFNDYAIEGAGNIAEGQQASQRAIAQLLASRGIRGDAAGAGLAMPIVQGQKSMSTFLNSISQLRDQRKQGILQQTGSFLQSLPVGQTSHSVSDGTSNTTGTQTTPGNMLGGLFGGAGSALAGLYGQGAFSGGKTPTSAPITSPSSVSSVPIFQNPPLQPVQAPMPSWIPNYIGA